MSRSFIPTAEVSFADMEEITGDMKEAYGRNIGVLFPDNSRMAAKDGQRYQGRYMVANNGGWSQPQACGGAVSAS